MKTLGVIFAVAMTCLAFLALIPSRNSNRLSSRTGNQVEEVVYMSDIDGLVKAVMLYGVTNGITYNGTNYVFVVEPGE